MTPPTIRRATIDDLGSVIELLADDPIGQTREDRGTTINPKYLSAFAAIDADPNQLLAVVEESRTIIGCLQLSFIPGITRTGMWRGQIEGVRIAGHHRGTGLGHTMLHWAIDQCRLRNCGLVQLTTDKARPDALRFYESLGFTASHEGMKLSL
jgi:GNAT superfamily N-acetyltransferase